MEDKTKKRILIQMTVIITLVSVIFLTILELSKNTILGWVLAIIAIVAFAFLRIRIINDKKFYVRALSWICLLALFAIIYLVSQPPVRYAPAVAGKNGGVTDVIHIPQGDLTGLFTEDGAVEVYAGIPYAEPPVGDLRWKEPVKASGWEGVLAADTFQAMSMQDPGSELYASIIHIAGYHDYKISLFDNYTSPISEDSLYLNVWKPQGDVSGLPVIVYIHGGSLEKGRTWYEDYSGEGVAREGVVFVSMAYRLGIFGFYADPELAAESSNGTTGNYGLLDQIMALEWVRDNIAYFGGDPNNVTLTGESAGSACVTALCTSPLAKGLFRRVVCESSTVTAPEPAHSFRLLDDAFKEAESTKERLGVKSIEEMRSLPAKKIVYEKNYHHHLTIDGYALTETPYESYAKGIHNEEAQLQGFNQGEAVPFVMFAPANKNNYLKKIREIYGEPYASQIAELLPASTNKEAHDNWERLATVYLFTYGHYCLERQAIANDIPSYVYYFTKENGMLGPWHGGELLYLYGNIPETTKLFNDSDRELEGIMVRYLINFVKYGDPNGNGLPEWHAADGSFTVLEFGSTVYEHTAPNLAIYEILDDFYDWKD
jgi:para-nitrobenzyl esterase